MSKEIYINNGIGFLSADVTSGAVTLNLVTTALFSATGNYTIKVDSEYMLVTAATIATPGTMTVTRGQEGSTAAAHLQGSVVFGVLSDGSLRRLCRQSHGGTLVSQRREINLIDGGGVTWTLTDDGTNDKVDISAAVVAPLSFEATLVPPVLTDYTWVNQGTATAVDDGKGIYMVAPPAGQNNIRGLFISTGAAPWSYVVKLVPCMVPTASANFGVAVRNSSSGKITNLRFIAGTLQSDDWTNPTTYSAGPSGSNTLEQASFRWLKVEDDNTNKVFSLSPDGLHWITYFTVGRTSFFTADQVGFYIEGATSGFDTGLKVASAKLN